MRFPRLAFLLLTAMLVAGCGYRLATAPSPDTGATRISVVTLDNDSREPGLELLVSEALRKEVLRRSTLRLVSSPAQADVVVRGRVRSAETASRSFSSTALALEYSVTLALEVALEARDEEPVVFSPGALEESELYLSSADVEAARKNRREALRRLSDVFAVRVGDALDRVIAR